MGLLPKLSSQQRATDPDGTPTPAWYRYLTALGALVIRVYFIATSQIARIQEVNLKSDAAATKANRALRLALQRSDGEWRERIAALSRTVGNLSKQSSLNLQLAQLRELETARTTTRSTRRVINEIQRNANKMQQFERELELIGDELDTQTTTSIPEGTNLYYTAERVDDRVAVLIQNGAGLTWTYNDGAGTLTGVVSLASFSTTNLSEGTNEYFTTTKARASLSGANCIDYNSTTGVIGITKRTGWTAATGTATRSTFDTASVTLPQLAERLKALIDDLTTSNIIGA